MSRFNYSQVVIDAMLSTPDIWDVVQVAARRWQFEADGATGLAGQLREFATVAAEGDAVMTGKFAAVDWPHVAQSILDRIEYWDKTNDTH